MNLLQTSIFILLSVAQYIESSYVLSNNLITSTEDKRKQCKSDEVYISVEEICSKKVSLEFECEYNEQCEAEIANSYCGYGTDELNIQRQYPVCLCKDGYHWVSSLKGAIECVPIQQCTRPKGFNAHELQGNCPKNQFCRNGLCLCKANFHYDENDKACVFRHNTCPTGRPVLIPKVGCFRQVLPGRKCKFDQQCNSLTENSFCKKAGQNNEIGFCQCSQGFAPTHNWTNCESIELIFGQIIEEKIDEYENNNETMIAKMNTQEEGELVQNKTTNVDDIAKANNRAFDELNLLVVILLLLVASIINIIH